MTDMQARLRGAWRWLAGQVTASAWSRRLADAWLPRCCVLCNARLGEAEAGLCRPCRLHLPGLQAPRCRRCAIRLDAGAELAQSQCEACTARAPAFDRTLVLADYAAPLDRAIVAMKFQGRRAIAIALGEALGQSLAQLWAQSPGQSPLPAAPLVVAVPLSRERLLERGYNQSQVMAGRIASALRLGRPAGPLRRLWNTDAQSGLTPQQRYENVAGVFDCDLAAGRLVAGRIVLLVDDVMTTGATFDAAADALKCAGAAMVICLAVARTPYARLIAARGAHGTGVVV